MQLIEKYNIPAPRYMSYLTVEEDDIMESLGRLRELEQDGLIHVEAGRVVILEKGKPFVRNICMAFDEYLWRDSPGTPLFSSAI